jgi:hypothetical protein
LASSGHSKLGGLAKATAPVEALIEKRAASVPVKEYVKLLPSASLAVAV